MCVLRAITSNRGRQLQEARSAAAHYVVPQTRSMRLGARLRSPPANDHNNAITR